MYIEQLYTGCLAEAAYYIESDGEAAVVDPIRETEQYIELAKKRSAVIRYVFETHFHADFVSGHIDLARKTGAEIVYGPGAETDYTVTVAGDGQVFELGSVKTKVLHTPGHTPESSCYLLYDEAEKPYAVFTGDTLFVGDVGRPDLAVNKNITQEDLAGMLYDSLNAKIKTLPDEVIVYPAHGAGSACGKNIGKESYSTVGAQKKSNYALLISNRKEFIEAVTRDLAAPPKYFFMDALINKQGYKPLEEVLDAGIRALSAEEVKSISVTGNIILLDTRTPDDFEQGHVPGSVNIGLNGQFAVWAGTLLDPNRDIVVVAESGKEQEAVTRLARVGYERVKGYLKGGVDAWRQAFGSLETVHSVSAVEFVAQRAGQDAVLDVRNPGEWEQGIIPDAELVSLGTLEDNISRLDPEKHYFVHCAGGYRSMIAASLLKRKGYTNVTNVKGGMSKIRETGIALEAPHKVADKDLSA